MKARKKREGRKREREREREEKERREKYLIISQKSNMSVKLALYEFMFLSFPETVVIRRFPVGSHERVEPIGAYPGSLGQHIFPTAPELLIEIYTFWGFMQNLVPVQ